MTLAEVRRDEPSGSTSSTRTHPSSARTFAASHLDGLAVVSVLAISVGTAAWFTRSFFYFQDDFIFLRQAQQSNFSLSYLRGSLFQHFSPWSRVFDYILVRWFGSNVTAARVIVLILFAASVLAFAWVISELVGPRWWRHLLTLAFGQSLALVHLLGWWTATANILPATLFGLLTIAGFLRYRRVGGGWWIALSVFSYVLSLGTHEQAWLVPGYLFLFDVLLFAPDRRLRRAPAWIWHQAWIWLLYGVLTILAMVNYFVFYYEAVRPRATLSELVRYTGIQFTQAFAPTAIGLRPLTTGWANTAALVFDVLALGVIVIVSVYRRPAAWRVWTIFAIGYLANSIMVGANRVGYFGVDFGRQLYYLQAPAYLFLLCVGAAFSLDRSGSPYVVCHDAPARPRGPAHSRLPNRSRRIWGAAVLLVGVGLYEVAFLTSATTQNAKDPSNQESLVTRAYFTRLVHEIATTSHGAMRITLVDGPVPTDIVAPVFQPYNRLSSVLAVLKPDVAFEQSGAATYRVKRDGSLVRQQIKKGQG